MLPSERYSPLDFTRVLYQRFILKFTSLLHAVMYNVTVQKQKRRKRRAKEQRGTLRGHTVKNMICIVAVYAVVEGWSRR